MRLNKMIRGDDYISPWVVRDIIPIEAEYRVLIIDGITKWIIPDYVERGTEHYQAVKDVVKKFKVRYPRDNYAIDVVISNNKALILDVRPYENMIDLRYSLEGPSNLQL